MKKIPTLFRRDPDTWRITSEVNPGCEWVLQGEGVAHRKMDGVATMLDTEGIWWARREVKEGKEFPPNFQIIAHDPHTGKAFGWQPIEDSPFAKFHRQAVELRPSMLALEPGTYELVGAKINGGPYLVRGHYLWSHKDAAMPDVPRTYNELREMMLSHMELNKLNESFMYFEGVVWHHEDGRMAKLKVRDFR